MPLKEDLDLLYQLQTAESGLQGAAEELRTMDDGMKAVRRAHEAKRAWEEAVRLVEQSEGRVKDRELALEGAEAERQDKWNRAYGGMVSDPKELTALERKIAELDRRKGSLEEEILGLYEDLERLRGERAQAEKRAREAALRAKQARAHFKQRTAELEQELERLSALREELLPRLPADLLKQYETVKERNAGVAVAPVVRGACSCCHNKVPGTTVHAILSPTRVVRCESCGCILVAAT